MAVDAKDLADELEHRKFSATYVLDAYTGRQTTYQQWKQDIDQLDQILRNEWTAAWKENILSFGYPHVPNVPLTAVEDRSRLVAAGNPSIVCRPESVAAKAKAAAEQRERIIGGYWEMNHVRRKIAQWASDLMVCGLAAVKVLPDFTMPKAERFPRYTRLDPRMCFPGPMFTEGPEPDDMIVSYKRSWRSIAKAFDAEIDLAALLGRDAEDRGTEVEAIEYYDPEYLCVIARYQPRNARRAEWIELLNMPHGLSCIPVAMTARPNPLAVYTNDFVSIIGSLRTWNRQEAMSEDAMVDRTYPQFKHFDVANPQDRGPDADLELESPTAVAEYIIPPGEPFSNYQHTRALADGVRAGALLPPSRTGDPNESIISAAGISAANSQMADHVRSLQRDCIAPMLQLANAIALCVDEVHCDEDKSIYGTARGRAYREDYRPSKVISGNYRNSVIYGMGAGLDEVNTNVLVLQQMGAGLIARRTARERSPFVENPQDEEKMMAQENLTDALYAGLIAQAAQGMLPSQTVAAIMKDLEKPDMTLQEAVARNVIAAPLAEPEAPGMPAMASGNAGAEQPTGFQGPPLEQLMAGGRPRR